MILFYRNVIICPW